MSLIGQQLGRYRILRLLGSGGMGDVYLAEDARINQQVAFKVIRTEVSLYANPESAKEVVRLFQREAKAIAKLDHPHILPLFDYGEEYINGISLIYLVTPYRQEGSLAHWINQRNRAELLSAQQVMHILRQAGSALQHAHDRQIIHQDVKPANFLIRLLKETPDFPDVLLADFGIARLATATSSLSHTVRGTPAYMAPEQWAGQVIPAIDQYALAVMSYELLTGRLPFQGTPSTMMYQHLTVTPASPSTLNRHLPKEVDAVLLQALAKQPEARFPSVMAFVNALQPAWYDPQSIRQQPFALPYTSVPVPTSVSTHAPTLLASPLTPPLESLDTLHATLSISAAEAQTGITRTVTLPGGRRVTVHIPAGVHNGHVGSGSSKEDGPL